MPISRSEGYRRGQGKEELGLTVAADFFEDVVDCPLQRILDADDNYRLGDFRSPSERTIECKRQPIDPKRYKDNFVEVCEVTRNARHGNGFADLAHLLDVDPTRLASSRVKNRDGSSTTFGRPEHVSVSIRSMTNSAFTVYVNPEPPTHIYVYASPALVDAVKAAVLFRGMVRGAGRSNQDTFAVFVPPPPARWTAPIGRPWSYTGEGVEDDVISQLRSVLV